MCRIIILQGDERKYIALSTFGFYKGGTLDVQLENFKVSGAGEDAVVSTISRKYKWSANRFLVWFQP